MRTSEDGIPRVLNSLGPGDYFGEMSMLEGRATRSVRIRAVPTSDAPVEVLKLSRADFEAGFMFENQKPGAQRAQHDASRKTTLRRRASVVPSASTSEVRSRRALSPPECLRVLLSAS